MPDDELEWTPATAQVADACLRLGLPLRATGAVRPVEPGLRAAGPARPVRHSGSVDIFLEVLDAAAPGDVIVVDNGGRTNEGCLGDQVVLEAVAAGIVAIAIWGRHRDTASLRTIGLPIFSQGSFPAGPVRLDPRPHDALEAATFDGIEIGLDDTVFLDDDGMVVVPTERAAAVRAVAAEIARVEQRQADAIAYGRPLRDQLRFAEFRALTRVDPTLSFRQHLRRVGGAIEA